MTDQPTPTAEVVPYLCVRDGAGALAWYVRVLGATESVRFVGDDGRLGHAELVLGRAKVMLSDEYPEMGVEAPMESRGSAVSLCLAVADVDDLHRRAVADGATSERAPADQPFGDRTATIVDPFGHR